MIRPYLALAGKIGLSNILRPSFPYKLTYAVTYQCNSRCKICNIWQRTPQQELTVDEIRAFLKASKKFSWIQLTGGEIFLRTDILDIMTLILEESPNLLLLNLSTNGLLTERIVATIENIVKLKPPRLFISVSLDGDETLNDELRGIRKGWQRQLETFRQLHHIPGIDVVLGMTVSPYNADHIERTFDAAKLVCDWLTYHDFHTNIFHRSYYYGNEHLELSADADENIIHGINVYRTLRKWRWSPISFLEHEYLKRVERYVRHGTTPLRCQALRASCFMDPAGTIYPCGMYDRPIGNVRAYEYQLAPIWQSSQCRTIQQEIWNAHCPQCWTPCEAYQSILGNLRHVFDLKELFS